MCQLPPGADAPEVEHSLTPPPRNERTPAEHPAGVLCEGGVGSLSGGVGLLLLTGVSGVGVLVATGDEKAKGQSEVLVHDASPCGLGSARMASSGIEYQVCG